MGITKHKILEVTAEGYNILKECLNQHVKGEILTIGEFNIARIFRIIISDKNNYLFNRLGHLLSIYVEKTESKKPNQRKLSAILLCKIADNKMELVDFLTLLFDVIGFKSIVIYIL